MSEKQTAEVVARLVGEEKLKYGKTLTSAVTTAWGVNWDEVYIARDLMQNFFDANRGHLKDVQVTVKGQQVSVTAPAALNLHRLFYLGSEKGEDDIGQYGEGFKVAATCLLRDHSVTVIACSGKDVLHLRVADQAVANTKLYPVEYDFYRGEKDIPGTRLVLAGCSQKLAKAMGEGLNHFLHDQNPLFGPKQWADYKGEFLVHAATDGKGHVFYRGLKRGEIEDVPLVLVINKKYEAIERKISKDRDRNAFGDEMKEMFYRHFTRFGLRGYSEGQRIIVEAARPVWLRGHPLLNAVADAGRAWPSSMAQEVFAGYYARCSSTQPAEQLEIDRLERGWRDEGKQSLPAYFSRFSALNAKEEIRRAHEKALEESKRQGQRSPTTAEMEAIRVLSRVLRELAPEVGAVFDKGRTSYTVAQTEALLGQLKAGRHYRSREVFLGADVLVADFAAALATFLHEHAHIFGQDGSRGFSDALTELLETVVGCRRELDSYELHWASAVAAVKQERAAVTGDNGEESMEEWLDGQSEDDLRHLLQRLSPAQLRRLRDEKGASGD